MNWEDECYLLSKRKFRENANIINVFTPNKGKVSGIVYGGNSRKIRNYLQISNKLFILHNSKNDNKIGYFKVELFKAISPSYFSDKQRTSALISICSLLNSLLPESQPYKKIYDSFEKFIKSINLENWIFIYIFLEINLIKELGFDTNLSIFDDNKGSAEDIKKITIDNYEYLVPNFLIKKKIPHQFSSKLIKKSLLFTRNILLNKFFIPNNLNFPKSRIIFENYFN
ncbi:MAG: DNA repair protein RecO [Candidatus Pelagibacter sp. TMED197]|nr:DNA repair protein RecO [Candidatus Pelagibacter sp.]OUW58065.1 MAG: DNA repair protein RecO [Candidatus Pelagibacter sp. TMED197]|tara:strand:- start:560 stop:1240 length:681 start_codon:yes stop_codon:yes gene_type:complete